MTDTLTIRDNRTGHDYELPITDGTIRAADLKQITAGDEDPRPGDVRPRLRQHGLLPQRDHLHRRRRGHPGVPGLPDRAAGRALDLPRGGLPAAERRAARPSRSWTSGCTTSRTTRSCTRTCKQFIEGFRYDAHPMGMLMASVSALSTFYPDAGNDRRPGGAAGPDHPDDRQDADARRVRLPARPGPAVRLPRQPTRPTPRTSWRCCSR